MAGSMVVVILQCLFLCIGLKFVLAQFSKCEKIDECSCQTDYGEISLWELAGTTERDKPRFPHIGSSDKRIESISWNPCFPYSEGTASRYVCKNVAACAKLKYMYYWGIATQDSATCELHQDQCTLKYTGKYFRRTSSVIFVLTCDEFMEGKVGEMKVQDDHASHITFKTALYSKYACPWSSTTVAPLSSTAPSAPPAPDPSGRSSGGTSDESSGLSLGSKLLITFFCILIAYIILGTVFNRYARHIEGKEAIPNYSLWADVPYLIKDGGSFTFHSMGRLCGRRSDKGGYALI